MATLYELHGVVYTTAGLQRAGISPTFKDCRRVYGLSSSGPEYNRYYVQCDRFGGVTITDRDNGYTAYIQPDEACALGPDPYEASQAALAEHLPCA